MGRPRKTPGKCSRFSSRLQSYVTSIQSTEPFPTQAAVAKKLEISASALSKLLTSTGPVSAQAVAKVCERVGSTKIASQLIEDYLRDHADVIFDAFDKRGFKTFRPSPRTRLFPEIKIQIQKKLPDSGEWAAA